MPKADCGFKNQDGKPWPEALVQHGPTLLVDVGFDPAFDPKSPKVPPKASVQQIMALVDTGATESCIDDQLALQLGLPIIDVVQIAGVGGKHKTNRYLAQIHVAPLAFTIYGAFSGVNLAAGGQRHLVLIGRTFLSNFRMTYNGLTGEVVIEH